MDSSALLPGPPDQHGVGVVAPYDFALDRELWRWVPDDVSLHLTRTRYRARASDEAPVRTAVRAFGAVRPEVVAYACTAGSFAGGRNGERRLCDAMERCCGVPALTTSGALLETLRELDARRVAVAAPYPGRVTRRLTDYLADAGVPVAGRASLGLTERIWRVPYDEVAAMARRAAAGPADALFLSCTNLPTYDLLPPLEAELGIPVLSANQVTMRAALGRIGVRPAAAPAAA
ncbi:decarboxylase [Streptomyces sp. A7024]|uniref:Decarboxylase n=1 Tax=Streptomyces coryli TaxID=1128680 RepID=A0A6G4UCQ3_9ACTN|nr:decarboxylase [Streptomyces coryli]